MSELKLYNTLTRMKEIFVPADPAKVRMYVCGPTVYDHAHIGNARPVIVFDVLYRLLRHIYGADHVTYVRNITDVDDKINARAGRDYPGMPLNEAIARVTEPVAAQFHKDVAALGCLQPDFEPRATGHIPGMAAMIQTLIDKKHAYVATGNEGREVLFSVASMPDYGQLSKRNPEDQQAGARVAVEAHKQNPADFVLWKESTGDEPGWVGTFRDGGKRVSIRGRPGWHIECSVMSEAHLGQTFDIHGGGLDLIFPHHENEIAQSRCAHGTPLMAKYWMHNGFLQVEGRKMSKSEGNFVTINELLSTTKFGQRKWSGRVLRFVMLMTHYREPIDWTLSGLEHAIGKLVDFANVVAPQRFVDQKAIGRAWDDEPNPSRSVKEALLADLNTPLAISEIIEQIKFAKTGTDLDRIRLAHDLRFLGILEKKILKAHEIGPWAWGGISQDKVNEALGLAWQLKVATANNDTQVITDTGIALESLGFSRKPDDFGSVDIEYIGAKDNWIVEAINRRLALLVQKNFAEADKIRADLMAQGIQLTDYKDPQTGEKKTKWEIKQ